MLHRLDVVEADTARGPLTSTDTQDGAMLTVNISEKVGQAVSSLLLVSRFSDDDRIWCGSLGRIVVIKLGDLLGSHRFPVMTVWRVDRAQRGPKDRPNTRNTIFIPQRGRPSTHIGISSQESS